jgi:putative transport protein
MPRFVHGNGNSAADLALISLHPLSCTEQASYRAVGSCSTWLFRLKAPPAPLPARTLSLSRERRCTTSTKTLNGQVPTGIDFVVLGLAIFLGGVIGVLVTFSIGKLTLALGTNIGTLLAGLLVGHLRTQHPLFARINEGAVAFMTSLGLAAFVGLTGIHAGPIFLSALKEVGIALLFGGMMMTLLPQIVGFLFGHYVLRMKPILLLGALTGAQTVTAAMAAVQERSGSPVAVLGYTPAYPVANILLTTWGAIMILVIAG